MCKSTTTLIAVLLATTIAQAADSPPAMLTPLAQPWSLMGNGGPQALPGACEVGIDRQRIDGESLYSVRCTNTALPSFGGARMSFAVGPYLGKRVRVSAAIMTAEVSSVPNPRYPQAMGEAGLWIGVGSPRTGLRADRMQERTIKGSTDWKVHDFVVDIPADANALQAGYWMQGKGQMWIRDLKVEEVPTTVPVNLVTTVPRADSGPDMSLATPAVPRPNDRFLPPPPKWLVLGDQGVELCDAGIDAQLMTAGQRNLAIACSFPIRAYIRQAFEAPAYWGKRVRFSGWIKTEQVVPREGVVQPGTNGQPGAALYMAATGSRGPVYHAIVTGSTEWTYKELVIDIPRGDDYIPVGLSLVGTGKVWLRDLKFEEVPRDTPVSPLVVTNP
jgi:hypothetical protein